MPNDWENISEDEILNFDGANTGQMARYERIMRNKTNKALLDVRMGLHDVKKATIKSSEKIEAALQKAEKSSTKFQKATIILTVVIAVATVLYTVVTWQAVQVDKEANDIQRKFLEFQQERLAEISSQSLKSSNSSVMTDDELNILNK